MSVQIIQPGFMPRPWLAKRERVQRSHRSLWNGLIVAAPWWESSPPIELITGRRFRWSTISNSFTMGEAGRGMVHDSTGVAATLRMPPSVEGTPFPITVAWYGWGAGTATEQFSNVFGLMYGDPVVSPFYIAAVGARVDQVARVICNRGGSRDENGIGGSTPNIGSGVSRPTLFIGEFTNGGYRYWIDHVLQNSASGLANTNDPNYDTANTIMFGTWNTTTSYAIHLVGYVWNRVLLDRERAILVQDPLGVVRPDPQLWMPMNMRAPLLVGDPNIYAPMPVFFS